MLAAIFVGGVGLAFRSLRAPAAAAVDAPTPAIGEPTPPAPTSLPEAPHRGRRPLKDPACPGEAFESYYELAGVALELDKQAEHALHAWVKNPAAPVPDVVTTEVRKNRRALLLLEQGARAERVAKDRRLNAMLGQRALALACLELALGRLELDASRGMALERAFVVVRFGQDVLAGREEEAGFLGAALENEGLAGAESWLERPGSNAENFKPVAEILSRLVDSKCARSSKSAERAIAHANERLATLVARVEKLDRGIMVKEGKTP